MEKFNTGWTASQNSFALQIRASINILAKVSGLTIPQVEEVLTAIMHELDGHKSEVAE